MERCQNLPLNVDDFEGIGQFARSDISLVVVGPEPACFGNHRLPPAPIMVFGPTKAGAAIEASLGQSSNVGKRGFHGTICYLYGSGGGKAWQELREPIVKADGLAAGKGVTVAATVEEAFGAIEAFQGQFGRLEFVLVEEWMKGVSFWL